MGKFVITIARESGAGGLEVAKQLSKELSVPYYNRDLLRRASDVSGINESLFGEADETIGVKQMLSAAKKVYTGEILPPDSDDYISSENLFAFQAKVLKEMAERNSCIILGRAGNFLLRDMPNVLNVFLYAPLSWRCERVGERNKTWSRWEAQRHIKQEDKRRGDYYRYYTGESWREASNYDICIDTSRYGIEWTARKIIQVLPYFTEYGENAGSK